MSVGKKNLLVKPRTSSLKFINDLLSFLWREPIVISKDYRQKVLDVKNCLNDDVSGLVNTVLEFAINSSLVHYHIKTNNENLTEVLNEWLKNINKAVRGKAPTGLEALAKEYFRERWKGSSFLLLRTFWETTKVAGVTLTLPTTLYFIDGEDITLLNDEDEPIVLGDEKYAIRINKNENIPLPQDQDEMIFVQKPFESWGTRYPTPYVIKKGLYRNLRFMAMLEGKAESIVGNALELLTVIKKGTERMSLDGRAEFTYNEEDLKGVSEDLKNLIMRLKYEGGSPHYITQFDTDISHLIPEYEKVLKAEIYDPIIKRILSGLGLVDIVQGAASTRRESTLNPKPFVGEVRQGIKDFKSMLYDIIQEIVERNTMRHRKWMNEEIIIDNGPIIDFVDDHFRQVLRSLYDRGLIAKRTAVELLGDGFISYDLQRNLRKTEKDSGDEELMYAPVIQNIEGATELPPGKVVSPDKTGPEKKNFNQSNLEVKIVPCPECGNSIDVELNPEKGSKIKCGLCQHEFDESSVYEEAPYKNNNDLPNQLDGLPAGAKTIWRKTFNSIFDKTGDEDKARKIAWTNVKLKYKKDGDSWIKKSKDEVEKSLSEFDLDELLSLKKVEVLGKQSKVLDELIKQSEKESTNEVV